MKVARAFIVLLLLAVSIAADVESDSQAAEGMGPGEFSPTNPPVPAPALAVTTRDGTVVHLGDLKGKPVLLNLWATWCAPCVREMPSLERLAVERGETLRVLAVSEDRRGADVVEPFIERHELKRLPIFLDVKSDATHVFAVDAIPTTILIDREGREVGRFRGPAEWDGPAARRLIDKLLKPDLPDQQSASAGR
jgi:thiol-disulfide isomerase/thioredoxin